MPYAWSPIGKPWEVTAYSRCRRLNVLGFFAVVVLDNASMHRSKAFRRKRVEWMSQRAHLIYLSAYSPELNLIEILWRQMKYTWLSLSAYLSFERLCEEVHRLLGGYGTDRAINFE